MSKPAKTLFYFAIYVLVTGFSLLAVPEVFIKTLQLPELPSGWARIVGLLAVVIGAYDLLIARNDLTPLIVTSVYTRFFFAVGVFSLIATAQMPVAALPLGLIDAFAATWTIIALRTSKRAISA